ncbi:MAG: Hsp20/alpha crystallin family protein [Pirellulaceae bacterium]|nr:Hsp20/alpha crystallin family protein [Pirellulaceae bacterium]
MAKVELSNRGGLSPFEDISHDMERIFDSLLGRTVGTMLRNNTQEKFVPMLDVAETNEAFEVSLDLPGVKPEQVKVEMHDGKLMISGERSSTTDTKDKNFHRVERASGSFYRVISLPTEVNVDQIDASYEQGVLHVKLPKVAKQQPKKIEIRSAGN